MLTEGLDPIIFRSFVSCVDQIRNLWDWVTRTTKMITDPDKAHFHSFSFGDQQTFRQ